MQNYRLSLLIVGLYIIFHKKLIEEMGFKPTKLIKSTVIIGLSIASIIFYNIVTNQNYVGLGKIYTDYAFHSATAKNNAAQVHKAIEDFVSDLVPYEQNLDYAYDSAIKEGRKNEAEIIKQQKNNFDLISEKVGEGIKWRTDYKNANPELGDITAENAYNKYLGLQGYRSLSSYLLHGLVDYNGDTFTKQESNIVSLFTNWEYIISTIDNINGKTLWGDIKVGMNIFMIILLQIIKFIF